MPNQAQIPDWLAQMDAQEAAQPSTAPVRQPAAQQVQIPAWLAEMDAKERPSESVTVAADKPESFGQQADDLAANVATGVGRVPGAIIGVPHTLAHAANWIWAQLGNAWNGQRPDGTWREGKDYDESNPLTKHTLSSEDVDKGVFDTLGVKPYEPESFIGKLLQAGVTGAGAGAIDPIALLGAVRGGATGAQALTGALEGMAGRAGKMAVASDAANATQQAFPDDPVLAAAAGFLGHAGASGVGAASRTGGGLTADATRQVFRPTQQGELEAARVLRNVDNTQPGLASPTDADLSAATGGVRTATDDIGPGLPAHLAGAELRSGLQARADALRTARSEAGDTAYDAFRAQPALPAEQVQPFMASPSFRKAVSAANAAMLDEGKAPLTDYWDFNAAGDPVLKPNAAVPPDVLGRVKSWLASAAANAPASSAEARTAGILDKRFGDFLDKQYPATKDFPGYAAVRSSYQTAGEPLGDFAHGPVAKALEADRHYGQSTYRLADERLPDLFLRSKATRSDLDQLIAASGGDRAAALSALQDHLASIAQSAVKADGTLDAAAFDKAMRPYQQSLGGVNMWFPELARKFGTAKQAQTTLDTLHAQRGLADAVAGGALRDSEGVVTAASLDKWLRSNQATLTKTQSPSAVMRLQSMASALRSARPGELADALKSEIAPTLLGTATGGLEGGVLATLLHKSAKTMFGNLDEKRAAAFSAAMERAVIDPAYAERLANTAAQEGKGFRPLRALVRAMLATPVTVNAGRAF